MKLVCGRCDAVLEEETADALHAAMVAHGADAHANHFEGKTPERIAEMKKMQSSHVHKMIADPN